MSSKCLASNSGLNKCCSNPSWEWSFSMKSTRFRRNSLNKRKSNSRTTKSHLISFTWSSMPRMHVGLSPCSMSWWMHSSKDQILYKKIPICRSSTRRLRARLLRRSESSLEKTRKSSQNTRSQSKKEVLRSRKRLKLTSSHLLRRAASCTSWMAIRKSP